jgi:MFS transporter, DHA3 family, macrolide efflux protein
MQNSALKNPDMLRLLLSGSISSFGDTLTNLAITYTLYVATQSNALLGLYAVTTGLPTLFLGPIFGVIIDRFDRRKIIFWSDFIRIFFTLGLIFAKGEYKNHIIFALGFFSSSISLISQGAIGAYLGEISQDIQVQVSYENTSRVVESMLSILGLGIAGLALSHNYLTSWLFIADALTFALAGTLVIRLRSYSKISMNTQLSLNLKTELAIGFRALISNPLLRTVLLVASILSLGTGAMNVLMFSFIQKDLQVPLTWLAAVEAITIFAGLAAMVFTPWLARRITAVKMYYGGLFLAALCTFGISVSQGVFVFILFGALLVAIRVTIDTVLEPLLITSIPNEVLGRVGTVFRASVQLFQLSSKGIAGGLASQVGTRGVFQVTSGLMMIAAIVAFQSFRKINTTSGK